MRPPNHKEGGNTMRSLFSVLAAGIVCIALAGLIPTEAQAQWGRYRTYYYSPAYPSYYYPAPVYTPPVYNYPPSYYPSQPNYWSGYYNVSPYPYQSGYYYQSYYPWTNQYYYQYRVYP